MANALNFNDMFWEEEDESPSRSRQSHLQYANAPDELASMPVGTAELTIVGQGTIAVNSKATERVEILVKTGQAYPRLQLTITRTEVKFMQQASETLENRLSCKVKRPESNPFVPAVAPDDGTVYWLSIDRSNWVLSYGKYYTCKALALMEVELTAETGAWFEKLTTVEVDDGTLSPNIKISRLPVTSDLPPLVVSNDAVSLRELDLAQVTTSANLPQACQNLYHNISGKGISLENSGFKQLAEAIHKSVTTPGYWGHNALKRKCKDPINPDPNELQYKYLRVTIGSNKGNSPGIPYVMEVWPPQHRSVIHDHGNACAVIRVLSGSIQCTWYDALISGFDPVQLGNQVLLKKDQVTWLGDNQYQIHALENTKDETCVTLQCYEFPKGNNIHEEKFKYIDVTTKVKEPFIPNSDCTFAQFYDYVTWEWKYQQPYPT